MKYNRYLPQAVPRKTRPCMPDVFGRSDHSTTADGMADGMGIWEDYLRFGRRGSECDGGVEVGGNGWSRLLAPRPERPS
ncbi:hypothetical protein PgNI_05836 [Pyricularia grisea]|uniref:Uncharacterized protein n=1 Tax=Pyricularia grisea TaxID=148305 RepID=A0A6P8B5I4_PYRGI|nr:hypothetical protein PgNI_05836 [Pyricularia grisea]TLD10601.1 hypothetical protein PgNI_05836 [Pyricularia grisea]